MDTKDPYICCLQETHFRPRDTYRMKVRGWKKIFHANGNQKKAGVEILLPDKIDFKIKTITRDKNSDFNTPLTSMDRSSRQKNQKEIGRASCRERV